MIKQVAGAETADSSWKSLYKVGGAAALIMVVFIPIQMIVFVASPPPSTVIDWFTLFQNNRLLGLLDLDLLLVIDNALSIVLFLALYAALRRASESFMAIAATLGIVGIAVLIATSPAFSMLSLSDQYAAAATEAQRSLCLAAGQAMVTNTSGTAFYVGNVIGSLALLIISVVMLRSNIFSKVTAYVGILANAIGLGFIVPMIGLLLMLLSVPVLWIWFILIARRLFQLGQGGAKEAANRS